MVLFDDPLHKMEEDYNMDSQDTSLNEQGNHSADGSDNLSDSLKDFGDQGSYDESFEDEEGGNNFRNNRGRGNFRTRGRGPPPGWMNGPPMRFRGRGYGPAGPPMRARSFFRTRGGPRFSNAPNYDGSWGPMGPPPPGMGMGGPPPYGPPPPGMMGGPMGPPPNMMGQPPPFSGPPGMPPPNMPSPELWVETKSEDGKSYYYHARTRETTWTRPQDTPTCKVVTQQEMEAMAASGQMPGMQQNMQMNGPMGGMPGMMPNGMMQQMMPPGQMPPGQMPPGQMPPGQMPPGQMPPGQMPPGQMPPGQMPPGQMPPGQMPPGQMPPGQMPPGQMPPVQMPPGQMPSGQMPPGQLPPVQMPPGQQQQQGGMPSYLLQPPPWVSKDGGTNEGRTPEEGATPLNSMETDDTPPGEAPLQQMPPASTPGSGNPFPGPGPNFTNAPPSFPAGAPGLANMQQLQGMGQQAGPPGGAPGGFPGAWGGWGGWPPPLVANPPPNLGNAAMPDAGAAAQQMPSINTQPGHNGDQIKIDSTGKKDIVTPAYAPTMLNGEPKPGTKRPQRRLMELVKKPAIVIPPELRALAAEWSTHKAPDGRPYYYHAARQESVWERPKPVKELEELQFKQQQQKDWAEKMAIIKDKEIKKNLDIIDVEAHEMEKAAAEAKAIADKERAIQEEKDREERERMEKERAEREKVEKEKADKEKAEKEKEKNKADKSRPISSTPISGTPWCVVWTGDGRVFFYNPTAHSSVWERPTQLVGRLDVDRAISQPPPALQDLQRKEPPPAVNVKAANGELKRTAETDTDDSDAEPIKKAKAVEKEKKAGPTGPTGQIEPGKDSAIEAEVRAARERGVVPHEQRLRSFLAMLHEKQVSAFSTWEKELHKIVFDPRYLMLNCKERRQVFDQYVRDRAEEERKEKKNRLLQKKLTFRTLLEEAKLHSKSSFTELASKHGRDERFKAIEKARERELYFNEFILEVRKKEKEDKEKKREQAKLEYFALLKEKGIDRHARFSEVKKKIDAEPRYKAVEGGAAREDFFREYCKQLKDDRRKDKDAKERDRTSKKEKKEKERDKDKEGKETKKEKKKEKGEAQTEEERKQPTPPPDQWAEILGIPGEEARARATKKALESTSEQSAKSSEEEMPSPKQLRSSKKEVPTPEKPEKSPVKSPLKKRKVDEFIPPEAEKKTKKKADKKSDKKVKAATDKTEKKKRKKTEKD